MQVRCGAKRHCVTAGSVAGGDESGEGGGAAVGAESTRLKLETPIFVAEALLQAAAAQLEIERIAATKEVRACCAHALAPACRIEGSNLEEYILTLARYAMMRWHRQTCTNDL